MADNRIDIIVALRDMASTPFKALADATKSYNSTLRALSGSADQVTGTIRNLFLAFGGYTVIKDAISTGYKFNSTIEETRAGIASLIFSMNAFRDSSGKVATGTEAFNVALDKSKDVQDELRIAGLKTAATYEQLTKAYSQSYVPAIKAGFDESQIVKFTTAATQAATAMRVPLDMLGEEVRSILSGNMTARNTILMPLMEAAGLTNEKIKELAASGQLYTEVMKAFEGAMTAADVASKNFSVVLSNLKDAVSQLLGQGLEKGFEKVKSLMIDLTNQIVTFDEQTNKITFNPEIIDTLQKIDAAVFSVIEKTRDLVRESYGFAKAHPVLMDLGLDFAKLALEAAGAMLALRKLGELLIWLNAVQMANLAFIDKLAVGIWGLAASTSAAAGAAIALGAAWGAWELSKLATEIWGAVAAHRELSKAQETGKNQQKQFGDIIAEFNRQTGLQVKDMLELGKARAEHNLVFDKEAGLWKENAAAVNEAANAQQKYTAERRAGTSDAEEYIKFLKEVAKLQQEAWKSIGWDESGEAPPNQNKALEKALEEQKKAQKKALEEHKKEYEKSLKEQEKAEQEHYEAALHQMKYQQDAQDKLDEETYKQAISDRDALNKIQKELAEEEEKGVKESERKASEKNTAYRQMYKDLEKLGGDYYDLEIELIDKEAMAKGTATDDWVMAMEWRNRRVEDLLDKEKLAHGDLFDGIRIGLKDITKETDSWAQFSYNAITTFSKGSKASLSTYLFEGIKGDFDNFSEYWNGLWDSMLKVTTDKISDFAVDAAMDLGKTLLGDFGGSIWDWGSSLFAHQGLWEVKEDEVPIIARKKEMILPENIAEQFRELFGGFGEMSSSINNAPGINMQDAYESNVISSMGRGAAIGFLQGGFPGAVSGAISGGMNAAAGGPNAGSAIGYTLALAATGNPVLAMLGGYIGTLAQVGIEHGKDVVFQTASQNIGWGPLGWGQAHTIMHNVYYADILDTIMGDAMMGHPNAQAFTDAFFGEPGITGGWSLADGLGLDSGWGGEAAPGVADADGGDAGIGGGGPGAGGDPGWLKGTGPSGLPRTGWYYGHRGEIVLNLDESESARNTTRDGRRILSADGNEDFGRMLDLLERLVVNSQHREMKLEISIDGERLDARILRVSDGLRVDVAERPNMATRRIY